MKNYCVQILKNIYSWNNNLSTKGIKFWNNLEGGEGNFLYFKYLKTANYIKIRSDSPANLVQLAF